MALGEQSWGLCMTCNNNPICIRRKGIRLPVLYCEEFDGWTPMDTARKPVSALEDEETALDRTMGLCCNCENRDSCTLQNSPGGIWHCEEYR